MRGLRREASEKAKEWIVFAVWVGPSLAAVNKEVLFVLCTCHHLNYRGYT